jgi:hypothetical protein
VIVSGDIETRGARVWVRVHGEPYIGDIAQQKTDGEFELRGEVPASQAQALTVTVEVCCYNFTVCGATVKLPPLQLSEGGWVNARTGKPVELRIELREAAHPFAQSYAERCPEG